MADAAHIDLQIITPDGVKLSEQVSELTAPSVEGEFGVLPGHRPLLAALRTGIVSYRQAGEEHRVAVGPGFVQVADDRARLLTDNFVAKGDVDPVRARLELKEADEALEAFEGEPGSAEHGDLVKRELWAAAQLELYGDPPPPTIRTFHEFQMAPNPPFMEERAPIEEAAMEQADARQREH
ncbi:MAG TPA: ATP synthase F1 subunit epsilon [Polyangiaceae bacterium]|nr:ATP synthase F1 subunit epsilon [Polyangiaceae bacterium]